MLDLIKRLVSDEKGQGMVEYGLIIALISVVVIAVLILVGDELVDTFQKIVDELTNANTP